MVREKDPFEEWGGYMGAKISKLENQVENSSEVFRESNLFEGISIFVNGWTNPSADELKRIMMTHGGIYHHYERRYSTYIIAENLPDVKIRNMNTSKIISPNWVVDCVKENRILDYSKYLLYTNQKPSQPKLFFNKKQSTDTAQLDLHLSTMEKKPILKRKSTETNEVPKKVSKQEHTFIVSATVTESKNLCENTSICETLNNKTNSDSNDFGIMLEILNKQLSHQTDLKSDHENISINSSSNSNQTKTAKDPKFLSEFYNNSRLHHIATLGAGFKQYITDLRDSHSGVFPARSVLREKISKSLNFTSTATVMHIDMDCFFVSVGLRTHPHLKGIPIAVTHSKGKETVDRSGVDRQLEMELYMKRLDEKLHDNVKSDKVRNGFDGKDSLSEIASCSYEARKMGVKNGMFVGQALKLCPNLKTIPYDFEGYKEVASTLYDTIAMYTLNIEAVSCDEMFVDLSDLLNDIQVDTMDFVSFIREEVKCKTQCPCSAGVGSNRLQARMATKKAKPDGQFHLKAENVLEYMANIPIKDLPGVGYSTNNTLKQLSLITCADLQQLSLPKLQMEFGKKFGETLYQACRGIDNRSLVFGQIRKSVSAEVNYGIRFSDNVELEKFLRQLCDEVHSRLTNINRKGKCITLKVMIRAKEAPVETAKFMGHGFCDHMSKSVSLSDYTCDLNAITRTVLTTMKALNFPPQELRGLGIQISKLDDPNEGKEKKENVIKNMFTKVIEKQKEKNENKHEIQVAQNLNGNKEISPKNSMKSPEKPISTNSVKGRGRSSKGKVNNSKASNSTVNSISNMFQNSVVKATKTTKTIKHMSYQPNEIDPSVLAELPKEIQMEILNENKMATNIISPQKESNFSNKPNINLTDLSSLEPCSSISNKKIEVDVEFLNALPVELRRELEKEIYDNKNKFTVLDKSLSKTTTPTKVVEISSSHFQKLPDDRKNVPSTSTSDINYMKENNIFQQCEPNIAIQNWIKSKESPSKIDIENFCRNVRKSIQAKEIYSIFDPIQEFYESVKIMDNCLWHSTYNLVVEILQKEMFAVYGKRMLLTDKIDCDSCM